MTLTRKRATVKKATAVALLAIAVDDQYLKLAVPHASVASFKERVKEEFQKLLNSPTCSQLDET